MDAGGHQGTHTAAHVSRAVDSDAAAMGARVDASAAVDCNSSTSYSAEDSECESWEGHPAPENSGSLDALAAAVAMLVNASSGGGEAAGGGGALEELARLADSELPPFCGKAQLNGQIPTDKKYADVCKMNKAKRHQIHRACPGCRAAKARCTDTRPCPRCIKLGVESGCRLDDVNMPRAKRRKLDGSKREEHPSFKYEKYPSLTSLSRLNVVSATRNQIGEDQAARASSGHDGNGLKLHGFTAAAAALPISAGPVSAPASSGKGDAQTTCEFEETAQHRSSSTSVASAQPFGLLLSPPLPVVQKGSVHISAHILGQVLQEEAAAEPFKNLVQLSQSLLDHVTNMHHQQHLMQQQLHLQQQQLALLRQQLQDRDASEEDSAEQTPRKESPRAAPAQVEACSQT
jgi:hypothetical protein